MISIHFAAFSGSEATEAVIYEGISIDMPLSIMLFTGQWSTHLAADLDRALKTCPVTIFGASYPALIHDGEMHQTTLLS